MKDSTIYIVGQNRKMGTSPGNGGECGPVEAADGEIKGGKEKKKDLGRLGGSRKYSKRGHAWGSQSPKYLWRNESEGGNGNCKAQ